MHKHLNDQTGLIPNEVKEETGTVTVLDADAHPLFPLEDLGALCHLYIGHNKYGFGNGTGRRR